MSSLFPVAEEALARLTLRAIDGVAPLDVVIGDLASGTPCPPLSKIRASGRSTWSRPRRR